MKKRWIQNCVILLIFAIAIAIVVLLGIRQGRGEERRSKDGVKLSEKANWSETLNATDDAEDDGNIIVYKTEKGAKYHLYSDCSSLRNSKTLYGLQKSAAEAEAKTVCSICEKRKAKGQ